MEKQEFGGTSGVNFDDDEGAAANLASNNQFCYVGTSATSPESNTMYFNADSVLCRARAKRGCATHPRSIAERVRG